jgi:hypothetical protein
MRYFISLNGVDCEMSSCAALGISTIILEQPTCIIFTLKE